MKKFEHPFSIRHIEDNSGFLLWQLTSIWQQQQKKVLEERHDISHSQYIVLASTYWLTLNQEEVTQVVLCKHTKIEPMTVSQILKGLQKNGYIERKPHSIDTRAKSVSLTPQGKALMKEAIETIENLDANFFKSLGKGINRFNSEMIRLIKMNS